MEFKSSRMIRKNRELRGLSQNELSRKIGVSSPQYISNIERSVCLLPLKHVAIVSKTLDLDHKVLTAAIIKDKVRIFEDKAKQSQ